MRWGKKFRRLSRKVIFRFLPKWVSHRIVRNSINLAIPKKESQLSFSIASTTEDIKAALKLVQNNYMAEGYAQKTKNDLRLTPYHLLPESIIILAKDGEQTVATISVIVKTPFGLPLESCFDIQDLIVQQGRVVEISALAVNPAYRGEQGQVLYNLMKFMYHCNVDVLQANFEVIGVNPKMAPLYEALMLFKRAPSTSIKDYDFANGAPVLPLYFDLDTALESYEKVYRKKPAHLNLKDFFLLHPPTHFQLPEKQDLDQLLPQRNPESLREILNWDRELIEELPTHKKQVLADLYSPWPECQKVFRQEGFI